MDIEKLKGMSTARSFRKGAAIVKEGATDPYGMFIILKGSVGVFKHYTQRAHVATLGAGDFFGEMSLLLMEPRTATVEALDDVIALEIDQLNSYEVIEKNPDLAFTIMKSLCERLRNVTKKVGK